MKKSLKKKNEMLKLKTIFGNFAKSMVSIIKYLPKIK